MLDTNSLKPLYIQLEAEIRQALNEKNICQVTAFLARKNYVNSIK